MGLDAMANGQNSCFKVPKAHPLGWMPLDLLIVFDSDRARSPVSDPNRRLRLVHHRAPIVESDEDVPLAHVLTSLGITSQ